MSAINSDKEVMRFFPKNPNKKETIDFINRMKKQFREKQYCYFAVDLLTNNEFIGFIGISDQILDTKFSPFTDIGWRLDKQHWNKGYATEGALCCLTYAKTKLNLKSIHAIVTVKNKNSIHVMKKIGMKKLMNFDHPLLVNYPEIKECVLFQIDLG
jgi:RimJ/RimL family protein N-acetyltransferase